MGGTRPTAGGWARWDAVERTIAALTEEVASLRAQLADAAPRVSGTAGGSDGRLFLELERINTRLARLEAAVTGTGVRRVANDALFGNAG